MADVISPEDVADLLTIVAPGFFARTAYGWVLPQKAQDELPTLVTSIALSLPLVALAQALADLVNLAADTSEVGYVALLLGVSIVAGYGSARARSSGVVRSLLLKVGHRSDPVGSVLVRTVMEMEDPKAQVTVNFKDGKRPVAGTLRFATEDPEVSDQQLYLDHVTWWDLKTRKWSQRSASGGVVIRLDEVRSIVLNRDPR